MENQGNFIQLMGEVKDILLTKQGEVEPAEIEQYFKGMDLSEEHYQAIYQYLYENGVQVKGFAGREVNGQKDVSAEDVSPVENGTRIDEKKPEISSKDLQMISRFEKELAGIKKFTEKEGEDMLQRLSGSGDEGLRDDFVTRYLWHILDMAKGYCGRGVYADEIIQEGNLGCIQCVKKIMQGELLSPFMMQVDNAAREAMGLLVDGELMAKNLENSLVAKSNLLRQATEYLSNENGKVPDNKELSEFTHMSEEEIEELQRLAKQE